MQLFSTFDNSLFLEMAISMLEEKGIAKGHIYAIPLGNRPEPRKLFDSIHQTDGISLIDIGMALGTAFSVIGISIGFKMVWGLIWVGIISAFTGFVIGVAIRLFSKVVSNKRKRISKGKTAEVILIVDCREDQGDIVDNTLWEHFAIGVGKVEA